MSPEGAAEETSMPGRMTAKHLGPEFHVTITEILADRGTVWLRVDSGYQVPPISVVQ